MNDDRGLKALKRLQSMRNTANTKARLALEDRRECEFGTTQYDHFNEAFLYWELQYYALDQAISILIDPDQLTVWENQYETIQSE